MKQRVRRLLSVILVSAMAFGCCFSLFKAPAVQAASSAHRNLVVVVRFAGDTTGDGATGYNAPYTYNNSYTYWDQFRAWFGPSGIDYFDNGTTSLASYMATISNGAYQLTSWFPQSSADGHTLTYITLPHNEAYYESAGDYDLISDAAARFNANAAFTTGSASWGSDGALENLELVVQVASEPETTDTLLWPHKSSAYGGLRFGGMKVYEYNLVNSESVRDLGTVKHEYLHTAGLGDLYRVGDSSSAAGPVGIWDCMGSAAGQWPLAVSLVDLGFESSGAVKTVSGAGTHTITLHKHYSTADDGQAVKVLCTTASDEYFVFEYRVRESSPLVPDRLLPSSGLIIYRVNDGAERDSNGHRTNRILENGSYVDAVYVFRPGETGLHDAAGDLQRAALSTAAYAYLGNAANARTDFGSADLTKGITDGAIVDSGGKNSGICVHVTGQTADSITFELTLPGSTGTAGTGSGSAGTGTGSSGSSGTGTGAGSTGSGTGTAASGSTGTIDAERVVITKQITTMRLGKSHDFNRQVTPADTTNKTYWIVKNASGKVVANTRTGLGRTIMNSKGIFRPAKAGTYTITAECRRSKTAKTIRAKDSIVVRVKK